MPATIAYECCVHVNDNFFFNGRWSGFGGTGGSLQLFIVGRSGW